MINDAYAVTAEEPVDFAVVARHVDQVSRVLGSDFSMQILGIMGTRTQDERLRLASSSNEMVTALCRYSDVFTDLLYNDHDSSPTAMQLATISAQSQHSMDKIIVEMEELGRNQRKMEAALAELTKTPLLDPPKAAVISSQDPATSTNEAVIEWSLKNVTDELQHLQEQIASVRKQFVTAEMFADIVRQMETWKTEHDKKQPAVVVGHRYMTGAPSSGVLNSPITPGSLYKRNHSIGGSADAETMLLALSTFEQPDRLKAQTKLDPLQVHRMNREIRPGGKCSSASSSSLSHNGSVLSGRTHGALSKIHARAQMLRPKSGVHNDR
jgi:hypothetical protein